MTRNEFITTTKTAISTYVTDTALADALNEYLDSMAVADAKSKARSAEKRSEKWASENGQLMADIAEYLTRNGMKTASEIATQFDISTSKATAVAKRIPNVDIGTLTEGSRVVKTYGIKGE